MLEKIRQNINHEPSNQSLSKMMSNPFVSETLSREDLVQAIASHMNVARHQIDLSYKVKPVEGDNHLDHILVKTQAQGAASFIKIDQQEIKELLATSLDITPNAIQMKFNLKPLSDAEARFYGKSHTLKDVDVKVSRVIAKIGQIRWNSTIHQPEQNQDISHKSKPSM